MKPPARPGQAPWKALYTVREKLTPGIISRHQHQWLKALLQLASVVQQSLSNRKLRLERRSFRSVSNESILFVMTATQIVFARMITRMVVRMINRAFIRFMIGLNKWRQTRLLPDYPNSDQSVNLQYFLIISYFNLPAISWIKDASGTSDISLVV